MGRDIAVTHDILHMVGGAGEKKGDKSSIYGADQDAEAHAHAGIEPEDSLKVEVGDIDTEEMAPPTDGGGNGHRPHGPPRIMRLVTRFNVPPGAGRKFIKAWKELECEVHKWRGSEAFSLFQVLGDNTQFVGYAAFKPPKGGPPKKGREVFDRYMEEIEDLGVSFTTTPIFNLNDVRPHGEQ